MANRSNRRRMSLSRVLAFEAVIAIRPRRADAHHGQEAPPSTNRSDIRAQSHLVANRSMRSRQPRSLGSILMPNPKREGRSIDRCAECHELSTAARPPACLRGAQSAGRAAVDNSAPHAGLPPQGGQPRRFAKPIPFNVSLAFWRSPYTPYLNWIASGVFHLPQGLADGEIGAEPAESGAQAQQQHEVDTGQAAQHELGAIGGRHTLDAGFQ